MATPEELLSRSVELVKDAYKESKKDPGNAEITEALMALREHLQVVREAFLELRDENANLGQRIRDLERGSEMRANLVRHMGVYWAKGDPDPWCPNCWENEQRATHMNPTAVLAGRLRSCPRCNYDVNVDSIRPPEKWPKGS